MSAFTGCAVLDQDNRRLLNGMDSIVQPESTTMRIALAPVAIPLGTVGVVTDMVLIHPFCVIPDAADDTYQLYWKPRDIDWLRKALLFPVCVVATPPTFIVDWLWRSIFDVPQVESVNGEGGEK
jgi:hypothetical protein